MKRWSDGVARSTRRDVIPANAGIHLFTHGVGGQEMDSGVRANDIVEQAKCRVNCRSR
jgi:hypothetical protein